MATDLAPSSTAANIIMRDQRQALLPIACRLIPFDQWLVSHVDTSWKVKEVKHWLLRKCNAWGTSPPEPPRFRPASPVTFAASSRDSVEIQDDLDSGTDDWDLFSFDYNREMRETDPGLPERQASSGRSTSMEFAPRKRSGVDTSAITDDVTGKFMLLSFANGHILDDEASLSWYKIRPYELFEMHRYGIVVRLPRKSLDYAEPYFDSAVMMLDTSTSGERDGAARPKRGRSIKKVDDRKAEWKPRWVVIREGMFYLGTDVINAPLHRYPLSSLVAIRGSEHLGLEAAKSHPRAICIKFDVPAVSSPETDNLHQRNEANDPKDETGTWVQLDLPDESAHDNLLRVLHRLAPHPTPSTFLSQTSSSKSLVASPTSEPTLSAATRLRLGVHYPEWRLSIVRRARKSGLGDIGPAMANWLYGGGEERVSSGTHSLKHKESSLSAFALHMRTESAAAASQVSTAGEDEPELWPDEDDEDDADTESEVEWEGWVHDIGRATTHHWSPPPATVMAASTLSSSSSPSTPSSFDQWGTGDDHARRARTVSFEPDQRSIITTSISAAGRVRSRSSTIAIAPKSPGVPTSLPTSTSPTLSKASTIKSKSPPLSPSSLPASAIMTNPAASTSKRRSLNLRLQLSQPDLSHASSSSRVNAENAAGIGSPIQPRMPLSAGPPPSPSSTSGPGRRVVRGVSIRDALRPGRLTSR
ncbi:hypothetical protein BD410DRAFT_893917 [Rickenella mellea]|uniref:PH domain-containing protein n=1 Tax=Rickenella mellea TaxID=50990 RepID=A0A4Y7QK33_9AGAM|nr:hypothetical protein BD410DRAFT_893917 [Rickenella mellea]